jgi:small subunit ribosomal protein S2
MSLIDKMQSDGTWDTLNKREKLFKTRQREKLEKTFGSIADMTRTPAAIFIVDIVKEHIALAEAKRLNIPTFAIVDTNSNPKLVDFPIPANDDATKSIALILDEICGAIQQGLDERKNGKEDEQEFTDEAEGEGLVPMEQVERPKRQRKAKTEGNEGTAEAVATVESAAAIEVVPVIAATPESEEVAPAEEIAVVSEVTETPVSEEVAPVEEPVVESEVVETTATEETSEETAPEVEIKEEPASETPSEEVEAPASEEAPTPNEE